MKKSLAVLGVLTSLMARFGFAQDKIELKLSHFFPPTHGVHAEFLEPWAKELERRTGGQVSVKIFPGNSSFGNVANQLDQVSAGVVDIAHGLSGVPRGRLPRLSILDLPFMAPSSDAATRALWEIRSYLKEDFKGLKILAFHTPNPGHFHTREKPLRSFEDLKGLRIRVPSAPVQSMLQFIGATPVGVPPAQVYESLEKGVIDGVAFPWDPIHSYKLAELLKYHYELKAYITSFYFVMNQKKFDSLPASVKTAIDAISGEALIGKFGGWWDRWDEKGLAAIKASGGTIVKATEQDREKMKTLLKPVIDQELAGLEAAGVKNAREIYEKLRAAIARFSKN